MRLGLRRVQRHAERMAPLHFVVEPHFSCARKRHTIMLMKNHIFDIIYSIKLTDLDI